MNWNDDEAYSYSFEEDWDGQGTAIPPRPDCLRSYEQELEPQPCCEDEAQYQSEAAGRQFAAGYANSKGRKPLTGVAPGRMKQLKTLYQSVVRLNHERNENSFVREAEEHANFIGEKARHVPFRSYWPTYEAMSQRQKEWYFYLRSQLRQRKYPKTDLSYLFVYIYEIINQVGVNDAADGLLQLCGLWSAYRYAYSILDKYLVLWVQDYILIYADGDFTAMMGRVPDKTLLSLFPDSLAGCFMENPTAGFTLDFISRFSDYRFHTGQLAKSNQGGYFLSLLPTVFQEVNQTLFQEKGKGIFGIYRPAHSNGKRRIAFQNAIYSGPVTSVCQDEIPYSTYPPLRSFFTSVIKETENRLREQAQIKGRLRGIELEPKVLSVIQSIVISQLCKTVADDEKKKLQVDRDRIIQLLEESNLIRQKLLEGIDEITRGVQVNDAHLPTGGMNSFDSGECHEDGNYIVETNECIMETKGTFALEHSSTRAEAQTSGQACTCELSGAGLLKHNLTQCQQSLLAFILQNGGEVGVGLINHAFPQLFLEMEMDEINQQAMEALGDIILAAEGGQWLLYDEYRVQLEGVFK
ncbi:MAG: TerB N-terminal domain-containing protein [Thermoclostridium sp.]|nr:TerB N-terminal domain-containing protein [Thermoclostridium sp.]